MKLAIDFGTTNTVIARWENGVEIVNLPGLSTSPDGVQALIPSLVYVRNGQTDAVTIGQAVREQNLDGQRDNRLFRNFKRGIVSLPAPLPRTIEGAQWDDRRVGETFLRTLLGSLPKGQIDQLVLTAPIAAFETYLSWLSGVMGELASEQVYIVDESTAAALGYAVTEPGAPVLVFDFGGGTLDLSLVQLPESREATGGILTALRRDNPARKSARVIAKAGQVIGGSDIDQWLLAWALQQASLTSADLGDGYTALLTICEQAKIRLSSEESTTIAIEAGGKAHNITIIRSDLEALLTANGFYDALRHIIDKVMHVAHRGGIFKEDVKYVLLVGGVSLMPSVQATLKAYFGESAVRADKPFTAVAEGALQVAAGYGLDDYLSQSYGLRYLDPQTQQHRYDEIIPMGSRYPTERAVEVELAAAHEGQTAIEFVIGEIGAEAAAMIEVKYEGGQTVFVAQADTAGQHVSPLNERSAVRVGLEPPAKSGKRRLQARFVVGDQRRLQVTVTDLITWRKPLKDAVIATLGKADAVSSPSSNIITGYEPTLVNRPVGQRLSLRGAAMILNFLPPGAISPDAAEAALRSSSFQARYIAALALSQRGDRDSRMVMQRVLADGSVPARANVARHLSGFTWYAVEPLFRQVLADDDSRVREAAVYALCDLRELNAYHLMTEALQDEEDNVRSAAAFGLQDCQDPAAVPVLKAALRADDPEVRVKTLEALSNNNSAYALPVVRSAMNDADLEVLYAATLSLLELAREDALDELITQIGQTQAETRATILRAFFHATNYLNINLSCYEGLERLLDTLEHALTDDLPSARMAAVWPLVWMRHEQGNHLLKKAYQRETDGIVKAHFVRVTVSLMSPIGDDLLQDALDCPEAEVRQAAEQIMTARRAGVAFQYDEFAARGTGLAKPGSSRLATGEYHSLN